MRGADLVGARLDYRGEIASWPKPRPQSLDRMTFFKMGKIWFSQLLPLNTP
jgi:hypothetical protein